MRRGEWRRLTLAGAMVVVVSGLYAEFKTILPEGPTYGLSLPPASWNAWAGWDILPNSKLSPDDCPVRRELDLFTLEEGRPVEPFSFEAGSNGWSRLWGSTGDDREAPGARLMLRWKCQAASHKRFEMDVHQNLPETEWKLVYHRRIYHPYERLEIPFTVRGNGRFRHDLGIGRSPLYDAACGIELVCLTPGAKVTVRSLCLAPYAYDVTWRRRFTLNGEPFRGGVSFTDKSTFELVVNGRKVRSGMGLIANDYRRVEIGPYLKKGENEILFSANGYEGYTPLQPFRIEAFAVEADGMTQVFPGGTDWEWRHGTDGDWRKPYAVCRSGLEELQNGNVVSDSSFPLHAGPLNPRPEQAQSYPVFDAESASAAWTVDLPPALRGLSLVATVRETLSGREVERRTFKGDGKLRCVFSCRNPGAYTVDWRLSANGREIDRTETEMVLVGPLDLPTVRPEEMDAAVARAKRLVQRIDCTKNDPNPSNFVDHACWYDKNTRLNAGRLVDLPCGRYRETGDVRQDLFAYRIDVGTLGKPHILEFDYPDDCERMIYCGIFDTFPVRMTNNTFPLGSRAWANATGSVRCGGVMPVSGQKKTLGVLFFPGSRSATVYFRTGLDGTRAAVSEIRVYEADDLPAMALPRTTRVFGNHNERPLFYPWGTFVTPKSHEYDKCAQWRSWAAAYWSTVNRIRQLKYCGMNASIEGGYMYGFGFPSLSGASEWTAEDFDLLPVVLGMYRHNGIRAYLSYEYISAPDLINTGIRGVSDKENWDGTAQPSDQVDRYGKQVTGFCPNINSFNPGVWQSMTNVMGELYSRYSGYGVVEGVVIQIGGEFQPSFVHLRDDVSADEVGYDDVTVGCFEKETGIRLGLPKTGRERFLRRYDFLMGKYEKEWRAWRRTAVKSRLDALRRIIRAGQEKWDLHVAITYARGDTDAVFDAPQATVESRDGLLEKLSDRNGCSPGLFDDRADATKLLIKADYGCELDLAGYGLVHNVGSKALMRRFDSLYLTQRGLNEHVSISLPKAETWWCSHHGSAVFESRYGGDNALFDVAAAIANRPPKRLFRTWLDVNLPTAFAEQDRKMAVSYYGLPEGDGVDCPAVTGVCARRVGKILTLVNNTPYGLSGTIKGLGDVSLAPFAFTSLSLPSGSENPVGAFAFDDQGARCVAMQKKILASSEVRAVLPASFVARLKGVRDVYLQAVLLRDFEAFYAVKTALGEAGLFNYVNGRSVSREK